MWERIGVTVTLAGAVALGCSGKDRCKSYVEHSEKVCIEGQTRTILVDGKPVGQLTSDDEARESCKKLRTESEAYCRKASDETLACAMRPFDDPERKSPRCQKLLEDTWAATHPDEAEPTTKVAPPAPPAPEPTPAAPQPTGIEALQTQVKQLAEAGKLGEAAALIESFIARNGRGDAPLHIDLGHAYRLQFMVLAYDKKLDEAVAALEKAVAIYEKKLAPDDPAIGDINVQLAHALIDRGRHADALAPAARAVAVYTKTPGPDSPQMGIALTEQARAQVDTGKAADALPNARSATAILEKAFGAAHPMVAVARFTLARALWDASKRDHKQARTEATAARKALAELPDQTEFLAEVDAWLAAHN
jgi:hypothetical protein